MEWLQIIFIQKVLFCLDLIEIIYLVERVYKNNKILALNIVLIEPEIPNNTGNIGRLSLAAGAKLHLVKPFGFDLSDKRVKRAGLDYWKHLDLIIYEDVNEFFEKNKEVQMVFLSSKGTKYYTEIDFQNNMFLVFGKESNGLSDELLDRYSAQLFKIPIHSPHIRSLNLANAVSVVVYEGNRKLLSNVIK